MCGRIYCEVDGKMRAEIEKICAEITEQSQADEVSMPTGEVFPTNIVPVVSAHGLVSMKWGFPMHGSSQTIINARSETAETKPMFSAALRERRIVIPVKGFFEWMHVKKKATDKYLFMLAGEHMLYLAGMYTSFTRPDGARENSFTILTTAANESMEPYHDRMPVSVSASACKAWICDPGATKDIIHRAQPELEAWKVMKNEQLSMFADL